MFSNNSYFKKLKIILAIAIMLNSFSGFGYTYGYSDIPGYLFEIGLQFYEEGRYDAALHEFKKALIVAPDYEPALEYVKKIQGLKGKTTEIEEVVIPDTKAADKRRKGSLKSSELLELEKDAISRRQGVGLLPGATGSAAVSRQGFKKVVAPRVFRLDDSLVTIPQPIEIEKDKKITILGRNIQKYLVTSPEILEVEQVLPDKLILTGKDIGYTFLHVWDDTGRTTIEFQGVFPKIESTLDEETLRLQEESAGNFKLRYSVDWISYESGRRIDTFRRSSYSWNHGITLTGDTPYGAFDSSASVRRLKTSTDLTFFTFGLTNAQIGPFNGFSLRGFDFSPPITNFIFSGTTLRGVMLSSPVADNKLDYNFFWGREGGGRYGNLSPGLLKIKHSFLEGFNFNYSPIKDQNYKFSLLHGYGRERDKSLNPYAYELEGIWNFNKWGLGYEIANDTERFAHLFKSRFILPKLSIRTELRNIDKNFKSITGTGWHQGEIGGIVKTSYTFNEKLGMNTNIDVYRDRLYPAPEKPQRLNENLDWNAYYQIDPTASIGFDYSLQNQLGRITQYRYQSGGFSLAKSFKFIRNISTYANYHHQENTNYTSHASDYINDKVIMGLRFVLIGDVYYYLNKEFDWFEERSTGIHTQPNVLETGVDWLGQFGTTPWYGNFRFTYHDEEKTDSNLSFFSGEDYIEGYSELSYRWLNDNQVFGSCRFRNVWADKATVTKRMEMTFNTGMRYLWDTGIRWESIGTVDGYVFKDYNMDGLKEKDEAGVPGIRLYSTAGVAITDENGYYKFENVKAKKAAISMDTIGIPPGFTLTTSKTQVAAVRHGGKARLDFGIISQTEIIGMVFDDTNASKRLDAQELGIRGVILILDNKTKVATDNLGRFYFRKLSPGTHTVTLDLNSLPIDYLPLMPLTAELTVSEGTVFTYNIPVKESTK